MTTFIVGVLAFLGGTAIGIFGMYLSDGRYLKHIQEMYDKREKHYESVIETQKGTIDKLIIANNEYQIQIQQVRKKV